MVAYDKVGVEVNVGDEVTIQCRVVDIQNFHGEDRSSVTMETVHSDIDGSPNRIQLGSDQIYKVTSYPPSTGSGDGGEPVR